MELMQLKYFLEVASTQHITKSAEKLNIAQPALTQSMHRLEEDIGVVLFEPKGRGITLTEYGRHFQQSIAPIIERLDRIPVELRRMAKLDKETIRINVLAASTLVTEAIMEYKKRSEANFSVFQSSGDVSDIEITTKVIYQVPKERQQTEFAISEKIYLAVPVGKVKGNSVSLSDMDNEGFICLLGSKQFRAICDKFCHQAGFKPNVIFESDNPTAVKNFIAASMGVGFWPEFTWGRAESEQVKLVKITDIPCSRSIVISCNRNKTNNENVKAFFEFLKAFFISKHKESQIPNPYEK